MEIRRALVGVLERPRPVTLQRPTPVVSIEMLLPVAHRLVRDRVRNRVLRARVPGPRQGGVDLEAGLRLHRRLPTDSPCRRGGLRVTIHALANAAIPLLAEDILPIEDRVSDPEVVQLHRLDNQVGPGLAEVESTTVALTAAPVIGFQVMRALAVPAAAVATATTTSARHLQERIGGILRHMLRRAVINSICPSFDHSDGERRHCHACQQNKGSHRRHGLLDTKACKTEAFPRRQLDC